MGGDESENIINTLIKVYDELDGDDQEKLEMLKALYTNNADLQEQLADVDVYLPSEHD